MTWSMVVCGGMTQISRPTGSDRAPGSHPARHHPAHTISHRFVLCCRWPSIMPLLMALLSFKVLAATRPCNSARDPIDPREKGRQSGGSLLAPSPHHQCPSTTASPPPPSLECRCRPSIVSPGAITIASRLPNIHTLVLRHP